MQKRGAECVKSVCAPDREKSEREMINGAVGKKAAARINNRFLPAARLCSIE